MYLQPDGREAQYHKHFSSFVLFSEHSLHRQLFGNRIGQAVHGDSSVTTNLCNFYLELFSRWRRINLCVYDHRQSSSVMILVIPFVMSSALNAISCQCHPRSLNHFCLLYVCKSLSTFKLSRYRVIYDWYSLSKPDQVRILWPYLIFEAGVEIMYIKICIKIRHQDFHRTWIISNTDILILQMLYSTIIVFVLSPTPFENHPSLIL